MNPDGESQIYGRKQLTNYDGDIAETSFNEGYSCYYFQECLTSFNEYGDEIYSDGKKSMLFISQVKMVKKCTADLSIRTRLYCSAKGPQSTSIMAANIIVTEPDVME